MENKSQVSVQRSDLQEKFKDNKSVIIRQLYFHKKKDEMINNDLQNTKHIICY